MTDKDPPPAYPSVVLANISEIGFKNERESPTSEQDIPPIQRIYPGLVPFNFFSLSYKLNLFNFKRRPTYLF